MNKSQCPLLQLISNCHSYFFRLNEKLIAGNFFSNYFLIEKKPVLSILRKTVFDKGKNTFLKIKYLIAIMVEIIITI